MMDITLRAGLFYREVDGAHILFDLAADRYRLLTGPAAACFERFLSGRATESDRDGLLSRGLIGPSGYRRFAENKPVVLPSASLVDEGLPESGLCATMMSLWLLRRARSDLRRRSLAHVLERLDRARPVRPGQDDGLPIRIAANFRRAERFASMQDQCLVRGVAMTGALYRSGVAASLVFGVTMPFAAHCWVQVGDLVLTDPFDVVRNYQPIYSL